MNFFQINIVNGSVGKQFKTYYCSFSFTRLFQFRKEENDNGKMENEYNEQKEN